LYEQPDDDSFGIETCSEVEVRSLNRVCLTGCFVYFYAKNVKQKGDPE
jgi:hypothetical protein